MESDEEIGRAATMFFKSLLNTSRPKKEKQMEVIEAIDSKLTEEQRQKLDSPFTKEEVESALKSMNPTKAPGVDGAHALLFQKYWDIVGGDTTRVCLVILNNK